jgi:8-oxo-dGTP pyrophosphatase MutT (NUDIX family)
MNDVLLKLEVGLEFFQFVRDSADGRDFLEEVVLVVPRPGGKVLLHTKAFYPPGTYRLPTGKMNPGEEPDAAFAREFREELGMDGVIDRKLGIQHCKLVAGSKSIDFISHIYLARESDFQPIPQDEDEQITGFKEVQLVELSQTADDLMNLTGKWRDWGRFRALAHEFAAKALIRLS